MSIISVYLSHICRYERQNKQQYRYHRSDNRKSENGLVRLDWGSAIKSRYYLDAKAVCSTAPIMSVKFFGD